MKRKHKETNLLPRLFPLSDTHLWVWVRTQRGATRTRNVRRHPEINVVFGECE